MLNDFIFFRAPVRIVAAAVALWLPMAAFGQPVKDSLDRDYAEELPRILPRSATEMLETFSAVSGYRMELAASEPTVVDPIAIDFDSRGRIYAVEMRGYSEDDEQNLGRIRLLEDRDGDGRYEASTVFVDNLSWPTALLCYDGGVFVGVAPDIWFFRDNNGDGIADEKRIVFTGFARSNVQGLLNSFRWSIDNRVEAATSSSGAAVNAPGKPDTPPLAIRGRDFSFDPRTGALRAESGGAQHGICFDQWGNKFVCSNSSHLQQVMFEDRYVARNPYLAAPSPRLLIANDGGQAEVYRLSPVEPWRLVRTRLRVQKLVRGPVEGGGRAAGYFTSATGLTIYLGDAWKKQDHGMAIVGDVGSNIVHRKRLQRESNALQYIGRRIDQQSEFIASDNIWFRPVQFKNGPDGCLYVIDMAREVIEHPASLPPIIKKHLDLTSGRDRGRIYRITPQGEVRSPSVALHRASITDLVAMLEHPNGWHRTTAARLIYSQRKPQAVPALRSLVANSKRPEARILALYALRSLDALAQDTVVIAMDDDEPQVRRHAIRVSESLLNRAPELRAKLVSMTNDKDIRVRYQLAFTLGELQPTVKTTPLLQLIKQDGDQRWMAIAIQSSLGKGAGLIVEEVVRHQEFAQTKTAGAWLARLSAQIGKQQRPEDIAAVLKILGNPQITKSVSSRLITGLGARPNSALAKQLAAVTGGSAAEVTRMLIQGAVKKLQNEKLEVSQRAAAVRSLTLGEFSALQSVFMDLLEPAQPVPLQEAALQTLARFTDDGVAELLLNRWATFSPKLRNRTGDILASRDSWAKQLVQAIVKKEIAAADVGAARLRVLADHPDRQVAEQIAGLMKTTTNADRRKVVQTYTPALMSDGDPEKGLAVFKKNCASCHQVLGIGHAIGPNLAAMRNRGAESILVNVMDPNREVNPEFLNYNLRLQDGRVLSGMIASESANSLELKRADNVTDTVLRIDIEALKSTGLSLMPEGLEKEITVGQMADLLAFLLSDL